MPHYDLHCHSTHSDGLLTPKAVVEKAAAHGVDVLALTDHDALDGLAEGRETARRIGGIRFVNGTELSVSWRDITLHIVGLNIDPENAGLRQGLKAIRSGRLERAKRMGDELAKAGIPGSFEGARTYAASDQLMSRTHFARYLVEHGYVKDMKDVFKRYLTPGKPGYVEHEWTALGEAIGWLHAAGGQAVLAHPGRYKVPRNGMRELLEEFKSLGGDAIEVHTSSHTSAQYSEYANYARQFGFLASIGSDYHGPGESWMEFGEIPPLPTDLKPVWQSWGEA